MWASRVFLVGNPSVTGHIQVVKRLYRLNLSPAISCARNNVNGDFALLLVQQRRHSSSQHNFQLDALTFSVSPEKALQQFEKWANETQGLRYLLRWSSVRIGASYTPVWTFDTNIRFVLDDNGRQRHDWKPSIFSVYGSQPVIYVSGLSAYAGYSYRRSLVNPVHNTTLVFMGDETQPFGNWMLRDMKLSNGERLEIFPDPWNATKGRAFSVIHEDLQAIADAEAPGKVKVQTEITSARRVYMPTYVIDYSVLGLSYRAFISGCDADAGVSGVSHKVMSKSNQEMQQASHSFLSSLSSAAQAGARVLDSRSAGTLLFIFAQTFLNFAVRVLARIPLISLVGGVFVGFRKIIQPWMSSQYDSAKWEQQREREGMDETVGEQHGSDFVDTGGGAQRYFRQNRSKILRHLGGEYDHEQGDFDWYKAWEEWARRQQQQAYQQQQQQYDQQQQQYGRQQQRTGYQQQQQQQQQKRTQKPKKKEFQWDFDPNDPYSVLGVRRGASKSEISAAFRREMLKHHPDVQAGASDAHKERAEERSKLITEAYRKLKSVKD